MEAIPRNVARPPFPSPAASPCFTATWPPGSSRAISRATSSSSSAPTPCCWPRRSTSTSRTPISTWSIHLDGDKVMHDKSVCPDGTYEKAVAAIKMCKERGFRTQINCTLLRRRGPGTHRRLLRRDDGDGRGRHQCVASAMPMSAPRTRSDPFPQPRAHQEDVPRNFLSRGRGGRNWDFAPIPACSWTSWPATRPMNARPGRCRSTPSSAGRSPCYLLGEGYAKTFTELMEGIASGRNTASASDGEMRRLHGPLRPSKAPPPRT